MSTPFLLSFRMALALSITIVVGHVMPLLVIGASNQVSVHWFWLLLAVVSSAAVSLWVVWNTYRSERQQKRVSIDIQHFMHELKSPITSVMIGLEGIRGLKEQDPRATNEYIELSMLELERMSQLVNNGLFSLQANQPGAVFQMQTFLLESALRDASGAIQLQLRHRKGILTWDIDAQGIQVTGDRMHLTNAIVNLLDNALKYALEVPRIQIRLWKEGSWAICSVRDYGIGISPQHQDRIFDYGVRIPIQGSAVKGNGVGLHYVARIIQRHGGAIAVDSAMGEGSTFTIRLPISRHVA
jgi:two-component system phosphate regulon sensor histidine kinase PhoR